MSEPILEPDEEIIEDNVDESKEVIPFKYSITSYGADFLVDGLISRMDSKQIETPPFQRGFVWGIEKSSRFIESLLLGLPVPGIFLSRDPKSNILMVIDGHQRLKTLQYFKKGYFVNPTREFRLVDVIDRYKGKSFEELETQDKSRLMDSIIHATIIKQDEPSKDNSSVYLVFERLNTGGMFLTPQEIRACIYHGEFNDLLKTLNEIREWRNIFGKISSRMRDQELILRYFALFYKMEEYSPAMKEFLNDFMSDNQQLNEISKDELTRNFTETIKLVYSTLGRDAFKPRSVLNAAVFDSVMIGITHRIKKGPIISKYEIKEKYLQLIDSGEFIARIDASTADTEKVKERIGLAIKQFDDVV